MVKCKYRFQNNEVNLGKVAIFIDKNKIALQLYSVRNDAEEDLYGVLKEVKTFGCSGVEFVHGLWGHDPLEVKAMCEEIGLVPLSAHVPYLALKENLKATILW